MTTTFCSFLSTPIGELAIFADKQAIYRVEFIDVNIMKSVVEKNISEESSLTINAKQQLTEYFTGNRSNFNLPLAPKGTPFRQQAWQALLQIPYGETRYYSQQAELMNNPKAVRAVGAANGANPIAIIIPCHRVIGKNGSLTGYAGGLHRKEWLLNFEHKLNQQTEKARN